MLAPEGMVNVDDRALPVYVATDPYVQAIGLERVTELALEGMLFVFPYPIALPFHMLNTTIPLEIAWFDNEGYCIGSQAMVPMETIAHPPGPYRYALELKAGGLAQHDIRIGSRLLYFTEM